MATCAYIQPAAAAIYAAFVRDDLIWVGLADRDAGAGSASFAAQESETLPMISRLLGHSKLNSSVRYTHLDDLQALQGSDQVGKRIKELLTSS